jgi:glycine betaine catabolism B
MTYTSKIIEVREETGDTKSIRFEKPGGFTYQPGHYGIFEHTANGEIIKRSYSISSSPTEDFIQITVKLVPNGKMSTYLLGLKAGDTLTYNAPFGKFLFDDSITEAVFIAGGSGISAFRAMIKYVLDKKLNTHMTVVYGSRSSKEIIMWDWLEQVNKENENLSLFLTVDKPDEGWNRHIGFVNADFIKEAAMGRLLEKVYFICGPPVMVTNMKTTLLGLGVKEENIKIDAWG